MKRLLIYGAGEYGQVVRSLAEECGFNVAGFIDDLCAGENILGSRAELLEEFPFSGYEMAMAIGYKHLAARWRLFTFLVEQGYRFPPLVHPRAIVSPSATIAEGSHVMAGCTLDTRASLGRLAVMWPAAIVNHDSKIGNNTFLSPGAIVCGHTEIGSSCFVGAGAVIVDHISVPDATFIKATELYSSKSIRA